MEKAITINVAGGIQRKPAVHWQRVTTGLLVLSVVLNIAQQVAISRRDAVISEKNTKIAHLQTMYDLTAAIEHDAVQAYKDLLGQVEAEKEARAAQVAAYESLNGYRYIGECTITSYCPCEKCCGRWADGLTATGIPAVPGIVAVDPAVIPIGAAVIIDGQRYLAADTGVTGYCVDIAVAEHKEAVERGISAAEVWVVSECS